MTNLPPSCKRLGQSLRCCLALLPLVTLGCGSEKPTRKVVVRPAQTYRRIETKPRDLQGEPIHVTAAVSKMKPHWGDGQQLFTLTLTNAGDKPETVHAIVYATNEETQPPRRAISPPTAYMWFDLCKSKDGRLTAEVIEKHWHTNAFVGARGGKLPYSWEATLKPGETKWIDAAHNLDERSPHPATKGKKLAKVGFTEYQIWLFTPDGQCFSQENVSAQAQTVTTKPPPVKEKPVTLKEPTPTTSTKTDDSAAKALRLARYYLDNNKPDKARAKLEMILSKYPKTSVAAEAKKLLAEIPQ